MANKAVIYCRYSPRPNAAECQSNAVQLDLCRDCCGRQKLAIVGEYFDEAASGDDLERPGLWDAVAAVPAGGVLVVAKLDRLARSVQLDGYIRVELAKRRATVLAADGSTPDDSAESVLLRQVLAAIAEYSKRITAARTRAAMLHAQASGRAMSAKPPLGKRREGKALVDNPAELAAIAEIVQQHKAGKSLRAIAKHLNGNGHQARGKAWHVSSVRAVLARNIAMAG